MHVYQALPAEGFEICLPVNEEDYFTIANVCNGQSRSADWDPMTFRIVNSYRDQKWRRSDAPWFGEHAMVFLPHVAESLETLLAPYGELLPISAGGEPAFIYNVTNLLDALDQEASDIARFPDSGDVMHVRRYEFRPAVIRGMEIFKATGLRVSPTFLSDRFVREWTALGFAGITFKRLWSSSA